jgi:hypothetical protein
MKHVSKERREGFQLELDFAARNRLRRQPRLALFALSLCLLASVFRGHAQSSFTKITTGPIVTDVEQSTGCAWGDYDNDGFLDLFVTSFDRISVNPLYHNERDGTFTRFGAGAPANESNLRSAGCPWADYDNDGFLDLFVANLGITELNCL